MQFSKELSLREVLDKYPEVPRPIQVKIDAHRRGIYYTEAALATLNPELHQLGGTHIFGTRDGKLTDRPESLLLRDGTSILSTPTPIEDNPYIIDLIDGKLFITDKNEPVEEVFFWPRPDYYGKKTKSGIPMSYIVSARPQRLYVMGNRYCHFWIDNNGCKFCDINSNLVQQNKELGLPTKVKPREVSEVIGEAIKEPGRFTAVCLTSGSNPTGAEPFDNEVNYYIELLQAIGEHFTTPRFPSQLISSAFNEKQLERIYKNTGLKSFTADIEVLNEKAFQWICSGKEKFIGYKEWKRRLVAAVDIFGRGYVNTCIVAGTECAKPYGFNDETEALKAVLEEAEDLTSKGVGVVSVVWVPRPHSYFHDQKNPSLEYYVKLALELHKLREKYDLTIDFDDYRRCGNHPDTDISRAS